MQVTFDVMRGSAKISRNGGAVWIMRPHEQLRGAKTLSGMFRWPLSGLLGPQRTTEY